MSEPIITKRCSKCKDFKPISEFYKDSLQKDGKDTYCKICRNQAYTKYRQTEKGKKALGRAYRKYAKTNKGKSAQKRYLYSEKAKVKRKCYLQTEKGKSVRRKILKQYTIRYPDKIKAERTANNAIKNGQLPRPDTRLCHYCPKPAQQYHHWHGYEPKHWLDVIPVCITCHRNAHKTCQI